MKQLVRELCTENPQLRYSRLGALGNVKGQGRHLLDKAPQTF